MLGIKVCIDLFWGYSIRIAPQGKGRAAYRFPPPLTFIGAYIAGIQQSVGDYSETLSTKSGKSVVYYSAAEKYRALFDDVFIRADVFNGKIYGEPIKQYYLYRKEIRNNVITMPGVFHQSGRFTTIYAVKEETSEKLGLSREDLIRGAWAITRLGAKEGIVVIKDVKTVELREEELTEIKTEYSFYLREGFKVLLRESYWAERVVYWKSGSFKFGDYSNATKGIVAYPRGEIIIYSEKKVPVFVTNENEILIRTPAR